MTTTVYRRSAHGSAFYGVLRADNTPRGRRTQVPRPQRELDPDGGPLVEFARELRALRARAGDPKFAAMSRRTGRSKTALADAVGGRHLARWGTVEDFVQACEADPRPWRTRWEEVRAAPASDADVADDTTAPESPHSWEPPEAEPEPALPPPRLSGSRRPFVVGVALGALLGLLVGGVAIASWTRTGGEPVVTQNLRVIEVQNKVAVGPDSLVEDTTPAYLSSAPIAYCASASRSCKVLGTEMGSGAAIVASCQVEGQRMVNFNLREEASRDNPYRADSTIWYRAAFPDGRSGYLSEVYVNGENRGGLQLPTCGPIATVPDQGPVARR